ncbi:hypothetical protein [uncultured Algibacter sp.]|uniref:hypothetical protein n=1 Tax=uncultured Algibacter sp. TaxID=298659 RepID=UPI0032170142
MKNVITIPRSETKINVKNISKKNIFYHLYNSLLTEYSKGVYAYGTISIIGQSCYASVAAMYVLMNPNNISKPAQLIQLFLVTIFCIGFNAMFISVQKPKTQVNALIASVVVSTVFLCSNTF